MYLSAGFFWKNIFPADTSNEANRQMELCQLCVLFSSDTDLAKAKFTPNPQGYLTASIWFYVLSFQVLKIPFDVVYSHIVYCYNDP